MIHDFRYLDFGFNLDCNTRFRINLPVQIGFAIPQYYFPMKKELIVFQVHQALGLEALKNRTFQIFKASATKGEGLDESMEWLSNALQSRK